MSSLIYVDRWLYPVETLGPGRRVALWVSGCSKQCVGCSNAELWERSSGASMSVDQLSSQLLRLSSEMGAHALTVTGGDPLEQFDSTLGLLEHVRDSYYDILLYTGYTLDELRKKFGLKAVAHLSRVVDVLVDGPYIDTLNEGGDRLRGSSNQRTIFCNEALRDLYRMYLAEGRLVQNFVYGSSVISVGIHGRKRGVTHGLDCASMASRVS